MDKLFEYQKEHLTILKNAILKNGRALDCSITGAGKTFCSIALCKELNLKPFIICPKSMIHTWNKILINDFNIPFYGIVNYESFINGTYLNQKLKKVHNPLLNITTEEIGEKKIQTIEWNEPLIPNDMLFIFDEAHRCKNHKTKNGSILIKLSKTNAKILLVSATIIDKDIYTQILVNVYRLDNYDYSPRRGKLDKSSIMTKLHKILFPEFGSRMTYKNISENSTLFKKNIVLVDTNDMSNSEEIQKNYIQLKNELKSLRRKIRKTSGLGAIIRIRQKIEILKVPTFIELTQTYISQNKSVVVFFNYNSSIDYFCSHFNIDCIVYGDQSQSTRTKNIHRFNTGESRIIVCNTRAGGVGISLHDTLGDYQRVSLISPTWSAQDLIQCLGRIHRANSQSDAIQRIIFAKNTDEEVVSKAISTKIENIGLLNDNDRHSYEFIKDIDEFNEFLEQYTIDNPQDIDNDLYTNQSDSESDDENNDIHIHM
jgi:superfamily II DNA or RNA helicase